MKTSILLQRAAYHPTGPTALAGLATLVTLAACEPSTAPTIELDLLDLDAWRMVDLDDDPWASERDERVSCGADAVQVEGPTIEVDTNDCGFATVAIPLLESMATGDHTDVVLYHSTLTSTEQATGVMALGLDGEWLRQEVPLPSAAESYLHSPTPPVAAQGDELLFHVHNHGANAWRLGQITLHAQR